MLNVEQAIVSLGSRRFRFDLSLSRGERLAIVGASGSGKTTALNLISGFVRAASGDVRWDGQSIAHLTPDLRPVTTLFQQHNLFEHLNVGQNIGLGIHAGLRLTSRDKDVIASTLKQVGLDDMASRRPAELSGGEQQRVALARALLRQKPLLLLDEPYSALDEGTRQQMLCLTHTIAEAQQLSVIMVTHQSNDAKALQAPVAQMIDDVLVLPAN